MRGQDVRNQLTACENCINSAAVSGCLMAAKPVNRSGSCLTCPCEYTFPHQVMLVSKKVHLYAAAYNPTSSKGSTIGSQPVELVSLVRTSINHIVHPNNATQPLQHACQRLLKVEGGVQNSLRFSPRCLQTARRGDRRNLLRFRCQRALSVILQKVKTAVNLNLSWPCFLIRHHPRHLLDALVCSPETAHRAEPPFGRRSHSCTGPPRLTSPRAANEAIHAANQAVLTEL